MLARAASALYKGVDGKFTAFSLSVSSYIESRSLLNVPEKQWKIFTALVYGHMLLSILLCVLGIMCFSTGMLHSMLYTQVSCSNGVNLFVPFLNVVCSFAGLVALRALHMCYPPLVHVVMLVIAIFSLFVVIIVSSSEADIWYQQAVGTPEPIPAGVKFTNWAKVFADVDVTITTVATLNLVVCGIELVIYAVYWFIRPNRL